MSETRRSGGSYRKRIVDNITDITPADFANPWNFFHLFTQSEEDVYFWCRQNGLLATSFPCHVDNCTGEMALAALSRAPGGEIMWRADVKTDIYSCFFDQLRSIYTLSGPPVYHYTTPLFETWTGIPEASDSQLTYWEIKPGIFLAMFCFQILSNNGFFLTGCLIDTFPLKFLENTDAETESSTSDVDHDDIPVITSDTTSSSIPPNRELSSMELKERRARMSDSFDALMHAMFSASDDSSEADNTLTGNFSFTTDVHACDTSSSHQHLKPLFNF